MISQAPPDRAPATEPIALVAPVHTPAPRQLGFIAGGPIADSFFDALPDDELALWESAGG
jgi:hypothetical protein